MINKTKTALLAVVLLIVATSSCKQWDNFTTYFNTYYNAERLMFECEDEFDFIDEKKRVTPNVYVPRPEIYIPALPSLGPPPFMQDLIISQQQRQPVNVKLDSILIKGSKILAHHPKSDYVENTLFLMAKTYFYKNEWLPSQVKCGELIDKYPDGEFSPDAHLLTVKNYLIQRKFEAGKVLLSRTIDIAWQKERYDILSEAFRIEAELALFQQDEEGALRPYRQAIAQTGNNEMRARWQVDLAALMFRMGKFKKAERSFAKVHRFSPDYQARFEADLYRASCLNRLGRYEEANEMLEDLESDGKWEEWTSYIFAQRINEIRLKLFHEDTTKIIAGIEDLEKAEQFADSAYIGNPAITSSYFEIGMDHFKNYDYQMARPYFARSKSVRSPIYKTAQRIYSYLNTWDQRRTVVLPILNQNDDFTKMTDSARSYLAINSFELGRVHSQLGNPDSAIVFYKVAVDASPPDSKESARYLYSLAWSIRDSNRLRSDSLFDVIVEKFPFSDYGVDARKRLGYTDEFVVDTAMELYKSGNNLRKYGDYNYAKSQYWKIFTDFPETEYAPKALYAIGWIWEKDLADTLNHIDSALFYYQLLINEYPLSLYAQDVRIGVDFLLAKRSGGEIPDSLKPKQISTNKPGDRKTIDDLRREAALKRQKFKEEQEKRKKKEEEEGGILNKIKTFFSEPGKMLDSMNIPKIPDELPSNPMDILDPDEEKDGEKKTDGSEKPANEGGAGPGRPDENKIEINKSNNKQDSSKVR